MLRRALLVLLWLSVPLTGFAQEHDMNEPPAGQAPYPRLKISGFGDVNFAERDKPEGARGFSLGQLALHMASELSPRVTFFGELSFSARADAGTGSPAV